MGKRRSRSILLLPGLIVVIALVTVLVVVTQSTSKPLKLPDGSMLTLEAVTYGRRHEIVLGPWWVKLVRPVVSESWRRDLDRRFHCRVESLTAPTPATLVFWTMRRGVHAVVQPGKPVFASRLVAFDEHGCEIEAGGHIRRFAFGWPTGDLVEAWTLPVFPRRGKVVGLRASILDANEKWARAFELTVPNPASGPHPVWQPRPLPLTAHAGDLAVTLTGLVGGVKPAEGGSWLTSDRRLTRATFQVTQGGRPTAEWEPVAIQVSDATGNTWSDLGFPPPEPRGTKQFFIEGAPWPDETAWKLRVEMARAASSAPEELWTFRDLLVPRPDRAARPNRTVTRHGVTLQLQGIFGPRLPLLVPLKRRYNASALLHLSPAADDVRLRLVAATDDRGRALSTSRIGWRGEGGRHGCSFNLLPGAKSLNLTFALQKSRFVEFLAKPSHP